MPPPFSAMKFLRNFSFSSKSQRIKPLNEKTFFKSNPKDGLVSRLCRDKKYKEAIDVLCEQKRLREAVQLLNHIDRPSALVYSTLLQFCLEQRALEEGKLVHAHTKSSGFVPGLIISNRFMNLYAKCGSLVDAQKMFDCMPERDLCSWNTMISGYANVGQLDKARRLFDEMPQRDNFSWTAMISGYVRQDRPKEALELYRMMQRHENSKSNKFTVSTALAASAAISSLRLGKEIHGCIMRTGLDSDEVVWSALSDMYGKCGSIEEARCIFDKMADRDVVSWTTMIGRYFEDGRREEGFTLFSKFMSSGVRPNEFTFAGVLNASADHAAEDLGKQVHGYMTRIGFDPASFAASALVHMYSKCGNIENAKKVFGGIPQPDLVSWTSLITGYSQHGQPNEALQFFELLLKSGTKPDNIIFVGVLSACAHAGLVDKGLEYFHSIKAKHGLTYTADHYACVVDLLARAGRFVEAENIINNMPIKPDKFLWASLLGGCRIHGNLELARRAAQALFEIEPENPVTYITLANIYATAGMWDEVAKVRKIMDVRGVVKKPGLSWIEIKREVHVFLVGDRSHPKYDDIHDYLGNILKRMKEEGYVPDTNFVLHDVEEEQKEQNLSYHSEKLAVAFGIISTPPGTPIKVFKNLRTCVDCHTAIKFISKIAMRKITVRDSNRFHCFEDGNCSCGDYW
ncbi:pentatricopeptide repeat-containing protein At4g37170 [Ziziphus jujuba]|uniref:Pentatricopeptide repeat-containing protein At4g37170 n=1 Tax=Ziziphus jujuba TaxID=326968 RepID=A0A6P3YS07_ZIZJJ|nr:pentatricopeptide repeat-containing protein At4g37170 [Ziziphus jujuba]